MVEAALWHARHALNTASDEGLARADSDLACGVVDGRHRRAAEAVHRDAAEFDGKARQQAGEAGDVGTLLRFRVRRAEDNVLKRFRIDPGALDERLDGDGGEIVRPYSNKFPFIGEMERRAGITCDYGPGYLRILLVAFCMMVIILQRTRGLQG